MKCSKCGFEDNSDSKFCSNCGTPLVVSEPVVETVKEEVKPAEEVKAEEPKKEAPAPVAAPVVTPVAPAPAPAAPAQPEAPVAPVAPAPAVNRFAPNAGAVDMGKSSVIPEAPKAPVAPVVPVVAEEKAIPVDKKAAKKAEKEAKKNAKIDEKNTAKSSKAVAKAEAEQAKIDACPKCYKPVSATKFFWLMLINAIPVVGLVFSFFASLISPNRNIKRFEKAACIWSFILTLIVAGLICVGVFYFGDDNIFDILYDLGEALGF